MARAIKAAGEWKPKATRVSTLILVLVDSTMALESSLRRLLAMPWRWARIFFASSLKGSRRERWAQAIQPSSRWSAESGGSWNT